MTNTAAGRPLPARRVVNNPVLRLLIITIALFVAFSLVLQNKFFSIANVQSMANQLPEYGILAIGTMVAMISGGIDLSIVSIANLSSISAALVLTTMAPDGSSPAGVVALAILAALLVGSICGLINGFLVSRIGIPAILATLGSMSVYTGIGYVITEGYAVRTNQLAFIGVQDVAGIPIPMLIFIVLVALFALLLNRTAYGFNLYMYGANNTAARFSGISSMRVLMRTYWLAGMLGAIAGIVFLARVNSAKPDYGESFILLTVLIAILGGVSYTGGFGRISGVVLAVLCLQFLSTGLNMLMLQLSGSSAAIFFRQFAWGALLLVVMVINYYSIQRQNRVRT